MGQKPNKHGLSRYIDAAVRRQIRQEAGFGCVISGTGIYTYEHIDPEFKDATKHSPECMTLLCHQCNQKKKNFQLSAATVWAAKKSPASLQQGFANEWYDFPINKGISLNFCGNRNYGSTMAHIIAGQPLFRFDPPEVSGGPVQMNCRFTSADGSDQFEVVNNEWRVGNENFDVEVTGNTITIRHKVGHIALRIAVYLSGTVVVDRVDLIHNGTRVTGDANGYQIDGPHAGGRREGNLILDGSPGIAHFENEEQELQLLHEEYVRAKRRKEQGLRASQNRTDQPIRPPLRLVWVNPEVLD